MTVQTLLHAFVANASCLAAGSAACTPTVPPAADMKLAHNIYK